MLTQLKERVLIKVYDYHYDMVNYYSRKAEKANPKDRAKFEDKMLKHTIKEALAVEKLIKGRLGT